MKTLLLVSAVAAYVCLGSADLEGHGMEEMYREQCKEENLPRGLCFQCDRKTSSDCPTAKKCRPLYTTCFTLYKSDGKGGQKWILTGCAKSCPKARYNEKVTCCNSPACNSIYNRVH